MILFEEFSHTITVLANYIKISGSLQGWLWEPGRMTRISAEA
jgi:hypothetical protein